MPRVLAAADLGSNTTHLLVAETDGQAVRRIDNRSEWIPLGEAVAREGAIPKPLFLQILETVREFRRLARGYRAEGLYLFATEGVRMASGHERLARRIATEAGVRLDVIAPRREAELSLVGMSLDTEDVAPEMMFEVGGGSAQIGVLDGAILGEERSLPLGTGRVIAESGLDCPCSKAALDAAERYVSETLEGVSLSARPRTAVACGGVVRGLWRALHPDGEKRLAIEEIDYLAWAVARLPIEGIVARFDVKPKRAATLLPGALVYRALLARFGLSSVAISEFGIREGAILEMARGKAPIEPV